jgi:curved DNA-binding protein CbpA
MSIHHRNLGIPIGADKAEIKRAYRKLAMVLHPDKNPDPKAAELFAELQDSYDALMNPTVVHPIRSSNTTNKASQKVKTQAEKAQEARRRYAEHMKREEVNNERYFQSLTSGISGIYFKVGWVICALITIFILLDAILPAHREKDEFEYFSSIKNENQRDAIHVQVGLKKNGLFLIQKAEYFNLTEFPELYLEKTHFFHFPTQVLHVVDGEMNKYKIAKGFWQLLPFPLFLFIIPGILLFYKKRTVYYTALYMISTYFVFPLAILFIITDYRWLHILTLGMV